MANEPEAASSDDWDQAMAEQSSAKAEVGAEVGAKAEAESAGAGESLDNDWSQALSEQADSEEKPPSQDLADASSSEPTPTPATLNPLKDDGQALDADQNVADHPNIDAIMDIPVTISLEVGRSDISIRNLLQLNQGSVVELDRIAGEPLDVLVNSTLIAHGEVVVVNEKFGIRLTDVLSQAERVEKLK